jgi:uncharacterized protein YggE
MKLKNLFSISLAIFLISASASFALAQEMSTQRLPFIRTVGESVVHVAPDRARIDVGVVTEAPTSQAAVSQNAQKLEATLARLRALLGAQADIKTVSYNVSPVYRYPQGGEPQITGYSATNIVRVTLDDLTKIGDVIDAATQAGANRIQQLQFLLKDEQPVQAQGLREAAQKARQKANALAAGLGLTVVRVLAVEESGQPIIPLQRDFSTMRAEAAAANTPIEPGTIEVRASVALTVQISQ